MVPMCAYAYDAAGPQKTRLDARGQLSSYTYDADDELTGRKYPDGTRATFAYDPAGNRITTENQAVTVTVTYDGTNRRDDVTTNYKV